MTARPESAVKPHITTHLEGTIHSKAVKTRLRSSISQTHSFSTISRARARSRAFQCTGHGGSALRHSQLKGKSAGDQASQGEAQRAVGLQDKAAEAQEGFQEGLLEKGSASSQIIQLHRKEREPNSQVN